MSTDKFVIRVVVCTTAVLAVLALLGMLAMAYRGDLSEQSIKEAFLLVAGAMIGVLARTSSPGEPGEPAQDVNVINPPNEPVPTAPGPPPIQIPPTPQTPAVEDTRPLPDNPSRKTRYGA